MPPDPAEPASRVLGFIVGTSRGGTTFMNKVLNLHPDVVAFGESAYFGRFWREPDAAGGRYSPELVREIFEGSLHESWGPESGPGALDSDVGARSRRWPDVLRAVFDERRLLVEGGDPGQVFEALCEAFCRAESKRLAIEKTPHHVGAADRILRYFPAARFIVMVREPVPFLTSLKNQGRQFDPERRERARRAYHVIPATLIWRGYARQAARLVAEFPQQCLRVSLDDLRDDESATMRQVQEHLGLPVVELAGRVPPDNSSTHASNADEPAATLSPGELWWLQRLAGTDIRTNGFDIPRAKRGLMGSVGPAVTALPWLSRNALRLRRSVRGSLFAHAMRYLRPR